MTSRASSCCPGRPHHGHLAPVIRDLVIRGLRSEEASRLPCRVRALLDAQDDDVVVARPTRIDHLAAPAPAVDVEVAGAATDTGAGADGGSAGGWSRGRRGAVRVRDDRTPGQRRADAPGVLVRRGAGAVGTRGGEAPRIVVHATVDQLLGRPSAGRAVCEQVGSVNAAALRRLSDDVVLQAVVMAPSGEVLRLGRSVRCFTPGQRRALLARDGGCVMPGCQAPSAWLEGHHVTAGTRGVRMVAGLPQVRAPGWTDPQRRRLHPPRRAAERAAQDLGHQLALDTG